METFSSASSQSVLMSEAPVALPFLPVEIISYILLDLSHPFLALSVNKSFRCLLLERLARIGFTIPGETFKFKPRLPLPVSSILQYYAFIGDRDTLEHCFFTEHIGLTVEQAETLPQYAIFGRQPDLVEWLITECDFVISRSLFRNAAIIGDTYVLEWIVSLGDKPTIMRCNRENRRLLRIADRKIYSRRHLTEAVKAGHNQFVEDYVLKFDRMVHLKTPITAIELGRKEMLRAIFKRGLKNIYFFGLRKKAISFPKAKYVRKLYETAICAQRLDILSLLGRIFTEQTECLTKMSSATYLCNIAAKEGSVEALIWLHENGFPFDKMTCRAACGAGQLDALKYLRLAGCPWSSSSAFDAAKAAQRSTFEYAIENGCPAPATITVELARTGQLDLLKWFLRHENCISKKALFLHKEYLRDRVMDAAVENGHVPIVRWCMKNGMEVSDKHLRLLAQFGEYDILKEQVLKGRPCPLSALQAVLESGDEETLSLLVLNSKGKNDMGNCQVIVKENYVHNLKKLIEYCLINSEDIKKEHFPALYEDERGMDEVDRLAEKSNKIGTLRGAKRASAKSGALACSTGVAKGHKTAHKFRDLKKQKLEL